jgi:hypothetical protein
MELSWRHAGADSTQGPDRQQTAGARTDGGLRDARLP